MWHRSPTIRKADDAAMRPLYTDVTEMPGDQVSVEQLNRLCHRYVWAGTYCSGKDVLEAGCGPGQGLGHLSRQARSLRAGDYAEEMIEKVQEYYKNRIALCRFDAQYLPFRDRSFDVIVLFEALYYLLSPERFVLECKRVLRPGGQILIATANKNLYDFVQSRYSKRYYGVPELISLFRPQGFSTKCFGYMSVNSISWRQRLFRPTKAIASQLDLIPKTMIAKTLLKRAVFGKLLTLPPEIDASMVDYVPPAPIPSSNADRRHKVIYCAARMNDMA